MSKKNFLRGLKNLALVYFGLLFALYFMQDSMIFVKQKYDTNPAAAGVAGFTEVTLITKDKQKISAWQKEPEEGKKIFLYLSGNAENFAKSNDHLQALAQSGNGVLAMVYRGYGKSEAKPTEVGFYADAQASIDYLKTKYTNPIIVVGRSIGTGVAVESAKNNNLAAIVLWSPYTSLPDIAAKQYPIFPIKTLGMVKYKFDSASKINAVTEPLLIIHGAQDNLIPISFAQKLFSLANNPKKFVTFADSDHNYFDAYKIAYELNKFAEENKL
jgi:fermentation-respiration switch protein FrsA (DUF1100 family)